MLCQHSSGDAPWICPFQAAGGLRGTEVTCTPAAMGPRAAVRIVWCPFQPVYSVVFEGVTTMIMSYFSEKNMFAALPALVYNW